MGAERAAAGGRGGDGSLGLPLQSNIVWYKIRADGGPDRRGVGFYFRNVTEILLFGVRGSNARTLAPARRQENLIATRKREHSRKPDELYPIVEACSPGPFLELFARVDTQTRLFPCRQRPWFQLGDEADDVPGRAPDLAVGPECWGSASTNIPRMFKAEAPERASNGGI